MTEWDDGTVNHAASKEWNSGATELERTVISSQVVHPGTGEVLSVRDAQDDQLARFMDEIRDYESRLREAKAIVNREMLRRLDLDGKWTRPAGQYTVSAPSPAPGEEFDGEALLTDLWGLVDAEEITSDAAERAVRREIVYKPQMAGIRALRKLGGNVLETVNRHATPVEKRRYVKVERG